MVVQLQDPRLLGRWHHPTQDGGAPSEYQIRRTQAGELLLEGPFWTSDAVSGILRLKGLTLEAQLASDDGAHAGSVRMVFIEDEDAIISNFRSSSSSSWSGDVVAKKAAGPAAAGRPAQAQAAPRQDLSMEHCVLGSRVIGELPHLVDVPPEAAPLISGFAKERKGTSDLVKITGGRYEVFLQGVGSEPFQRYARKRADGKVVLDFVQELRGILVQIAQMNGGVLSEDIVALVGGSEMQVPHVDLKEGQVQVIVALHSTAPTLVFDPAVERPSDQQVCEALCISYDAAAAPHLAPLFAGGSPLTLPAEKLYQHMVPACKAFDAGDAVQIRDGVVHAGPKSKEVGLEGIPRVVVFSTYSPQSVRHYDVNFQYKIWDWASFDQVPPLVAYDRLFEVHTYAQSHGMSVFPWTHYEGKSMEACKTLCTTAGLDGESIEWLVQEWRKAGRGPAQNGWVK